MNWQITNLRNSNIILVEADTNYALSSMFIRLQEFYESTFKSIRGKYFTLEQYMDLYALNSINKTFSYFTDWVGFNVPGHIVKSFFEIFNFDLSRKEIRLLQMLQSTLNYDLDCKFYLIGIVKTNLNDVYYHELAHAFYYLNTKYRRKMESIIQLMDNELIHSLTQILHEKTYDENTYTDEIQAYLATEKNSYIIEFFRLNNINQIPKEFKKVFLTYLKLFNDNKYKELS